MGKWIAIIVIIIIAGTAYVLKNGGGLEMQEEHKVETPVKPAEPVKAPAAEQKVEAPAKTPAAEPKK